MSGLSKNVKIIIAAAVSVLILVAGIATGILISSHRGDKDSYKASEESDSRNEQVISSNGTQKDKEQDKKWTDALLIRGNQKARRLHSMNLLLPIMEAVQLMNGR